MFEPARIGDPITHDMLVPSGAIGPPLGLPMPSVVIEGQPAANAACTVLCTSVTSAGPAHPPTPLPVPIVKGSATVLICGAPAVRWSPGPDFGPCGAFIGDPKLAFLRTVKIGG